MTIYNDIKIKSNQIGNSIYMSDLNDLYNRAIMTMRYKASNWLYGFRNFNEDENVSGYTLGAIPFFIKSKRLMVLIANKGITDEDDTASQLPLIKLKIRRASENRYLTLVQSNGRDKFQIDQSSDYSDSNGNVVSGSKTDFFYSYCVIDFTPNESNGSSTIVDADGVPIDNRILIEIWESDLGKLQRTLPNDSYLRIIEIGSGIDDSYKTQFFDGQVIPKKMIQGLNSIMKYEMKGYENTSKYENYQNFIFFQPNFISDGFGNFRFKDNTYNNKLIEMFNKTYQDRTYNFSTSRLINVIKYDSPTEEYYDDETGKVISDDDVKRIKLYCDSNNKNFYLNGVVLSDGVKYIWNEGKIHRADLRHNFTPNDGEKYDMHIKSSLYTNQLYSSSILFQHNFIDYDTVSATTYQEIESWKLFNFLGDLSSDLKRPIDNIFLSYICNMLNQPFWSMTTDEILCHTKLLYQDGIDCEVKQSAFFTTEFYDTVPSDYHISIENFNSDSNHNIYIKFNIL